MTGCSTRLYDSFLKNRKYCSWLLLLPSVSPHSRMVSEFKGKSKNNQEVFERVLEPSNLLTVEGFPFVSTLQFSYPVPYPAILLNAADTASQQNET